MASSDADRKQDLPPGQSEVVAPPVAEASRLTREIGDEVSPPTAPIYLRPKGAPPLQLPASPEVRTGILTGQSAAFVDSLTKAIAERLAATLRPVVASAVDDLLPMLLTLGHVPGPDVAPADQADAKTADTKTKDPETEV